jgi:hypothetical protein
VVAVEVGVDAPIEPHPPPWLHAAPGAGRPQAVGLGHEDRSRREAAALPAQRLLPGRVARPRHGDPAQGGRLGGGRFGERVVTEEVQRAAWKDRRGRDDG